jgi:hypothetical protein
MKVEALVQIRMKPLEAAGEKPLRVSHDPAWQVKQRNPDVLYEGHHRTVKKAECPQTKAAVVIDGVDAGKVLHVCRDEKCSVHARVGELECRKIGFYFGFDLGFEVTSFTARSDLVVKGFKIRGIRKTRVGDGWRETEKRDQVRHHRQPLAICVPFGKSGAARPCSEDNNVGRVIDLCRWIEER